ncbi:hypothetical protein GCM10011609_03070 [Lentzea pudingi]|uniref:NACHT domain-containing protein n=1 Tax=Lentzea pudingi TaxID=1789439 RepID=A0ABQ2HAS6_9PSEU|nr:NACHT domain-containing protein [Lentzea pudingi]GGM70794.1 hypothetical protein GCM10011609_03070 [Lentzea pudingi]
MARDDLDFSTGDVTGGTVFQANNVHGDVHLHPGQSPRKTYDPPRTWAEAKEPPPEIRSLLRAQIHAAREAPYRLPEAPKTSLDTVYVRQDLGSPVEEPQHAREGPVLDDDGRLIETPARPVVRFTVRPPSRPLREALDADAHLVVTGGPGLGKSTLTLRLAAEIAQHWVDGDEAPLAEPVVPLRLPADALAARSNVPFAQALAESTIAEYGSFLRGQIDQDLFVERVVGCRWMLLVDGLDEVVDVSQRHRLVSTLAAWAAAGDHRILLTTRPTEGGALAPLQREGAVRNELQPFDEAALRRFAANWFSAEDAQRFLRQIGEAHLGELVQVPLMATIVAIIFSEYGAQPLPGNQYSLYETYLAHIRRDQPDRFDREKFLEHLARTRLETNNSLLDTARSWVTDRGAPASPVWREELTAYLLAVGPLVLRGGDLAFQHQSFAEHLAATSCARELPDEFNADDFADRLHAAEARESGRFARAVLLHHTRLHPGEADRLLEWLHRGTANQHLLAARLLAHHLPASSAKTEAFLATVRAWAMTTHYNAVDILAEASRTTRFTGLAEWLTCLMNCTQAPWRSRAEAATALAVRVRGPHSPDAFRFLRHVVDDPQVSVSDRLTSAEALAQCGTGEREIAVRGLRAVLSDPNTESASLRAAAVILAGLGDEDRVFAIESLFASMSDAGSSPTRVVKAATGLLEIDPAFAEVCAAHFLVVLRSPAKTTSGWYDAALGLASVGPDHLDAAVAELSRRITDRSSTANDRVVAAQALRELGPLHRQSAGELIAAAAGRAFNDFDRSILLGHLVTYGPQREEALAGLRTMLAEPRQNWNNFKRVASALRKAGPAFQGEVATALLNSGVPSGSHDHVLVLDELVELGEPYRTQAVRDLHSVLDDPNVPAEVRCRAASALIRSGPDHHWRVINRLWEISTAAAYQELARAGAGDEALTALLACARFPDASDDVMTALADAFSGQDGAKVDEAAAVLRSAASDAGRSWRVRRTAADGLARLGDRFGYESAAALSQIIRSDSVITGFRYIALQHSSSGPGPRRELAAALLTVLADERSTAATEWNVVVALKELGHGGEPEVLSALERLASFPGLAGDDRAEAAVLLASRSPEYLDQAVNVVLAQAKVMAFVVLRKHLGDLRASDVDLSRQFRARLMSRDSTVMEVIDAANALEETAEVHRLAQDETLSLSLRYSAIRCLTFLKPDATAEAAGNLSSVRDDDTAPAAERARATGMLTQVTRKATASSLSVLWRLAQDSSVTLDGRATALHWLDPLERPSTRRYEQAVTVILRDPEVTRSAWGKLIHTLPRPARTDLERSRLHDRSIRVKDRVPIADLSDDLPLRDQVIAELRDVIAGPETSSRQRVDAAVALCEVSVLLQAEAVAVLERLGGENARSALAGISRVHWWRVHDEALAEVEDEGLPLRDRHAAARLLDSIDAELDAATKDVLCAATPWRRRLEGQLAAGRINAVRTTRDDVNGPPVVRERAAWTLRGYSVDDRAAGVVVLENLANDEAESPPVRSWAAEHLDGFGIEGFKRAAIAARSLMMDPGLPVLVRADAGVTLHDVESTSAREVLNVLTGLVSQVDGVRRVRVLSRIGEIDSSRAVGPLQELGMSATDPVVRMRCARALVTIRRDQREKASVIARAVAWDEAVPWHVRLGAARDLALWSELMREDARVLLVRLRDCGPR